MKFAELDLKSALLANIQKKGYKDLTSIQEKCYEPLVKGQDIAGLSHTGTGKTAAFLIPLIERVLRAREDTSHPHSFSTWHPNHWILIVVPTRELAHQVNDQIKIFTENLNFKSALIYGGVGHEAQSQQLKAKPQFVVGTPGRLIDFYKDHVLNLSQVQAVVFDEADRLFDMGFKDQVRLLMEAMPQKRQFLIYSATLNFDALNLAYEFGANPFEVNVSEDKSKATNVTDEIYHAGYYEKPAYLLSFLKKETPRQTIIFTNFKRNVERLAYFLTSNGFSAQGISSLLTQEQRNRVLANFRKEKGEGSILVATDVAARGLDIKGVDMIINYEIPDFAENYVHRIGRTGRAEAKGKAFSLVDDKDLASLQRVEEYLGHKVKTCWLSDKDFIQDFKPFNPYPPSQKPHFSQEAAQRSKNKKKSSFSHRYKKEEGKGEHKKRWKSKEKRRGDRRASERTESTNQKRFKRRLDIKTAEPKDMEFKKDPQTSALNKRKRRHHRRRRQGSYKGRQAAQSQNKTSPSLGQKVSGFFKKIFK